MKILVTGATGYLGRRVMKRLSGAEAAPRVDLSDFGEATKILSPFRWDAVVNAAGPAPRGLPEWDQARDIVRTHVGIAMNLAKLVPHSCRVVHVSSAVVYGMPRTRPVSEDHPCAPLHPYGLAKVLAEDALATLPDVWLLRVGGLFSEERTEGALYNFLRAIKQGNPLRLTSSIPLVWEVLHVDDAAEAIARTLEVPGQGPVNVSTGEPIDLAGTARRIAERYGGTVEDAAGIAHPVFQGDTSKLRRAVGWSPPGLFDRLDAWWKSL